MSYLSTPLQLENYDDDELLAAEDDYADDAQSLFVWRQHTRILSLIQKKEAALLQVESDLQNWKQKKFFLERRLKLAERQRATVTYDRIAAEIATVENQEEQLQQEQRRLETERQQLEAQLAEKKESLKSNVAGTHGKKLNLEDRWKQQAKFLKQHEKVIQRYGLCQDMDDSKQFLLDFPQLLCEECANYLVLWAINLEVEESHDRMVVVAHQGLIMEFLLELGNKLETDPRNCVRPFFTRIQAQEKVYLSVFNEEVERFKQRIKERAKIRLEDAVRQVEEEEKLQRLGPGGLDPLQIFPTLPKSMQLAFEKRDEALLEQALTHMRREDADYHMTRCVRSGLWILEKDDVEDSGTPVDPPPGFFYTKNGYICKVKQNILNDYEKRRDNVRVTEFDKKGRQLVPGDEDMSLSPNPSLVNVSSRLSVPKQSMHSGQHLFYTPPQSKSHLGSNLSHTGVRSTLPDHNVTSKLPGNVSQSHIQKDRQPATASKQTLSPHPSANRPSSTMTGSSVSSRESSQASTGASSASSESSSHAPGSKSPSQVPGSQSPSHESGSNSHSHKPGSESSSHKPGSKPSTHATGSKPSTHATGSKPSTHATGSKPSTHPTGSKPSTHTTGSKPSTHATGSRPSTHATGSRPSTHATGSTSNTVSHTLRESEAEASGENMSNETDKTQDDESESTTADTAGEALEPESED